MTFRPSLFNVGRDGHWWVTQVSIRTDAMAGAGPPKAAMAMGTGTANVQSRPPRSTKQLTDGELAMNAPASLLSVCWDNAKACSALDPGIPQWN